MIMVDFIDPRLEHGDAAHPLHALIGPCRSLRPGLPGTGHHDN